ncbi:MAG: DUF3105 domain-containing protein [Catenulispora sp.]
MAKDGKPAEGRTGGSGSRTTATKAGSGSGRAGGGRPASGRPPTGGKGGRTRPPSNVVTHQRPWGLIAGAVAVVVFAVAVITYAVVKVHQADALKANSPSDISGLHTYKYASGQQHVTTPVDYKESPPVGGPHDPYWADCTGTVYSVDIRHENAVHAEEHGAVWVTYNPKKVSSADIKTLAKLVQDQPGRLMSPYAGLDSPISIQSWNHQLKVSKASDTRLKQFADFFTTNSSYYPEIGASCENPDFKANPVIQGQQSEAVGSTDAPTAAAPSSAGSSAP